MADKVNWLPAAIGAAVSMALVSVRIPNADRNLLIGSGLVGAAVGYGLADFIEDRSVGRTLGRIASGGKNIVKKSVNKVTTTVTGIGSTAGQAARRTGGQLTRAGSTVKTTVKTRLSRARGWLKRRF
jgi:hypothetical protein